MKRKQIVVIVSAVGLFFGGAAGLGAYHRLSVLETSVAQQWRQIDEVYHQRLELVPELVETLRAAPRFDHRALAALLDAKRAALELRVASGELLRSAIQFEQHQRAQDQLSGALLELRLTVERYPEIGMMNAFRDLLSRIEAAESRITTSRLRYNMSARAFNAERDRFPSFVMAELFADRFGARPSFVPRRFIDDRARLGLMRL